MTGPLTVFIGYDLREDEAYQVCRASLLRHSSVPLHIVKLDVDGLKTAGFYRREWRHEGGQRVDMKDLKPFSTDFAFTRFMVPALSLYQGWSLFCDCDFLFTDDIAMVFDLADDKFAAMCVKHEHDPKELTKMGGLVQSKYHRKNWSSLVLYNNAHPANRNLTGWVVNEYPGRWLHAFSWLKDDEIGALFPRWNWLSGVSEPMDRTPAGIHFTLGIPTMPKCGKLPYADLWRAERAALSRTERAA